MPRGRQFSPTDVIKLETLLAHTNWGTTTLAKRLGWSEHTILRWKGRIACRDTGSRRVSRRNKPLERKIAAVLREKKKKNNKVSFVAGTIRKAAKKLGMAKSTVWNHAKQMGLVARVRRKATTVKPEDLKRRLKFALVHVKMDPRLFFFSDEVVFHTNDVHGNRFQWVFGNEEADPRLSERWPQRVMVWAGFSMGLKVMVLFDYAKDERLDAPGYKKKVLERIVPQLLRRHVTLVQDGARAHVAKANLEYLRAKGVSFVADWPARSPQLNPAEQLWPPMHKAIAAELPGSREELIEAIHAAWKSIPTSFTDTLVLSFKNKCAECIRNRGK